MSEDCLRHKGVLVRLGDDVTVTVRGRVSHIWYSGCVSIDNNRQIVDPTSAAVISFKVEQTPIALKDKVRLVSTHSGPSLTYTVIGVHGNMVWLQSPSGATSDVPVGLVERA